MSSSTTDVPTERATFSMACFWVPDALFGSAKGVIRTKVGYTGGTSSDPTYRNLSDHTETIQIDYDPNKTNYAELLELFWKNHNPFAINSRQYMSAIFFHDENQQRLASETKAKVEREKNSTVTTVIRPAEHFYDAEDYHQKNHLRQHPALLDELKIYPDEITNSHVCARLNGYVAGYGDVKEFEKEWAELGLNEKQAEYVKAALCKNSKCAKSE